MALVQNTDNPDQIQQFDFSVNLLQVILWQYNNAKNAIGLLKAEQAWYDANQQAFWENWVRNVFDMRTATDFGLSVWSRILDLPLYVNQAPSGTKATFGYGQYYKNYNRGNYKVQFNSVADLPIEIKRIALRLRYFQLVSCGAAPEINRFLNTVFGPGVVYVLDGLDMTQTYVFTKGMTAQLRFMLDNLDVLPRAACVKTKYVVAGVKYFGYGSYNGNYRYGYRPQA